MTPTLNYPLTLLYDGACPICSLEMDNLRARDSSHRLVFVDIAPPGFNAAPYGATLADMQALIHAVRPDGSLVIGVPALRLAYQAVGLGALAAPTAWPLLAPFFDWAYRWFARKRYSASGVLTPLIAHVAARRAIKRSRACADGLCAVVASPSRPNLRPRDAFEFMPNKAAAQVIPADTAIKNVADDAVKPAGKAV